MALGAGAARAGPPLISDDPHTIGRGRVEAIFAMQTGGQRGARTIAIPQLDLTIGLVEGLDLTFIGSPAFVSTTERDWYATGNFELGAKWRPIATSRWTASFTPTAGVDVLSADKVLLRLPVQVESRFGRLAIGVDAAYEVVRSRPDGWLVGTYATWRASPELLLLGEVWSVRAPVLGGADFGAGLGTDWTFVEGWSLLAMLGTGLASYRIERVEWVGYLGVRWAFGLRGATHAGDRRRHRAGELARVGSGG